MRIPTLVRCASVVLAASVAASCGNVARTGRSPVQLVINTITAGAASIPSTLLSDVLRTASAGCTPGTAPCIQTDTGGASLSVIMKDEVSTVTPSNLNQVTITRYHVAYRRSDGRNVEGVDVPYSFDGGVTATVASGTPTVISFELVRAAAKRESPLVQLVTPTVPAGAPAIVQPPLVITTIADVTFFGHDQAGNELSATGSLLIDFGDFPG